MSPENTELKAANQGKAAHSSDVVEMRENTFNVMRHGEAEQNVLGIVYGRADDNYALTSAGKAQVEATVGKLSGITKIFASPIRRAKESAEVAADVLGIPRSDIQYDERLRELDFGVFHGKPAPEFLQYRNERIHSLSDAFPDGESYLDAKRRFGSWLYETDAKLSNENVLVVTHGIGIESLTAVAGGVSNTEALAFVRDHFFDYAHLISFKFVPLHVNEDFELIKV
jgi:broad specificity phosphatase PhoE